MNTPKRDTSVVTLILACFLVLIRRQFSACVIFKFLPQAIRALENKMRHIAQYTLKELTPVSGKAKLHSILALLEGLVGFSVAAQAPLSTLGSILGIVNLLSHDRCPLKSLEKYSANIEKGLSFGEDYKLRVDSSELDFDKLDISSLPEMMQVRTHDYTNLFYFYQ